MPEAFQGHEHANDLCFIQAPKITPPGLPQEGNFHSDDLRRMQALQGPSHWSACQLTLENLAKTAHCSTRQLGKLFHQKLGITPGLLLRAMVTFADTAKLMREETCLLKGKRRGCSPLRSQAGDYRRRLQRLLGISYSELRQAAKAEHWAVVWMRKWRERLKRETGREGDGEKRRAVDLEEMFEMEN